MDEIIISWTQTAVKQRNYIFNYWNERNKSTNYSQKLNQRIKERTNQLKSFPKLGKRTDFKQIRTISIEHYSILYSYADHRIIITGFWDNRQNPKKIFKFLKRT